MHVKIEVSNGCTNIYESIKALECLFRPHALDGFVEIPDTVDDVKHAAIVILGEFQYVARI